MDRLRDENIALLKDQRELRRLQSLTLVDPHWKGTGFEVDPKLCYLLMPYSEDWSNDVWLLIQEAVASCSFLCQRADEQKGRVVMENVWEGISRARVVIADLTTANPNVTYEVGLADVLGKDVLLLSQSTRDTPFDFQGQRLIVYENTFAGASTLRGKIRDYLDALETKL